MSTLSFTMRTPVLAFSIRENASERQGHVFSLEFKPSALHLSVKISSGRLMMLSLPSQKQITSRIFDGKLLSKFNCRVFFYRAGTRTLARRLQL